MVVIEFLVNEILSVPAYLVGIIVAVGLIAMRKSSGQIVGGALKATLGFLILGAGAGVVVASLEPLGALILAATGAQGVVPTNEAIVSIAAEEFGAQLAWVMVGGFVVHLVIARFFPLKYVFLTGHHIFFMSAMLTAVLATADIDGFLLIIIGSIMLGTIMSIMPALWPASAAAPRRRGAPARRCCGRSGGQGPAPRQACSSPGGSARPAAARAAPRPSCVPRCPPPWR